MEYKKDIEGEKITYLGVKGLNDKEIIRNIIYPIKGDKAKEDQVIKSVIKVLDTERNLRIESFNNIDGIDEREATIILSAIESGRRWPSRKARQIRTPVDAYNELRHYADRDQEHLVVLALNGAQEILFSEVVAIGSTNAAAVRPADLFSNAVRSRATGIIIAHNHPSNQLKMSSEDKAFTARIFECSKLLGIQLLDHIIMSETGFISLKVKGIIP